MMARGELSYHVLSVRDLHRLAGLGVHLFVDKGRVQARMLKLDAPVPAEARELARRVNRHVLELLA